MSRPSHHEDIIAHMAQHFGPVDEIAIVEVVPATGITINVIPAEDKESPLILFTTGMSDRPQYVPPGAEEYQYTELFIKLPADWPVGPAAIDDPTALWPILWMRRIGYYPHVERTWLGGPFPIIANGDPPEPLAEDTELSCLLALQEGDEHGTITCRDGRTILLYSLVPLYTEERDLEIELGIRELFNKLQEYSVSTVVDTWRINVATGE